MPIWAWSRIDNEEMSLTQTGHAVGTPWFMPLEQARNAKEIDGRSDIYALGCTLYAFLTGRPPFMGRTIVDVIQAKEVGTFTPARQANSDVPERLDLILAKMTAKHPKNRYQTCEEVIKDIESLGLASEALTFLIGEKPGPAIPGRPRECRPSGQDQGQRRLDEIERRCRLRRVRGPGPRSRFMVRPGENA